ncbi:MAG TPA: sigma-70 family RNA polymerase sigma factor [Bacteroidetes bacterium]|nr:sigma-70 family RNA polymerase sigma factor [Bacteroidota bacterium]
MQQFSDSDILEMLRSGEPPKQERAFRRLYQSYYKTIENLVNQNSGSPDDVKDVFHDGLIVLFNNAKKEDFQLTSSLKTYLYSVCRNIWLMKLRKVKKESPLKDHHKHIPMEQSIFDTLVSNDRKKFVESLLEKLSEDCRRLIVLYYFNKMKMAQLKEVFGLGSEQAAKNKKSQCMKKLRQLAMNAGGAFYK